MGAAVRFAVCTLSVALAAGTSVHAQGPTEAGAAEIVAARYVLEHHVSVAIYIDSAFARAEDAPGGATSAFRGIARMRRLVTAFGADATSSDPGNGVYLVLSDPVLRGDSADVTITVWYPTGSSKLRRGYETLALTLVHDTRGWTVRRKVQLGIS